MFEKMGVSPEWIPLLLKSNIKTVDDLKAVSDTKLCNDLNGLRKKMKLSIAPLQLTTLQTWLKNI